LLAHLIAVAAAFDDLQIGAPGGGLAAEIHGGGFLFRVLVRTRSYDSIEKIKLNRTKTWHYIFTKHHPIPSKINDLCRVHLREL
jgi:hypothetical protein